MTAPSHLRRLLAGAALFVVAPLGLAAGLLPTQPVAIHDIAERNPGRLAAYVLRENERTIILDYPNVAEQGAAFGRIVLFIERHGASRKRVMSQVEVGMWLAERNEKIDSLTVGNNFTGSDLARFFNATRSQNEKLTTAEMQLQEWLIATGVLKEGEGRLAAAQPEFVLLTIPQVSQVDNCSACTVTLPHRKAILEHELAHARFATDDNYRSRVLRFWRKGLTDSQRAKFTAFLRGRGYDASNPELLANEMQAFLMHTPVQAMFNARSLGVDDAELAGMRQHFAAF